MKTITIEVADNSYQIILNFIQLLPPNCCHIIEPDDILSIEEQQHITKCLAQIQQGDYSEFDDLETVINQL